MPYLHSLLVLSAMEGHPVTVGAVIAEVATPVPAEIHADGVPLRGVRYTVEAAEGDGIVSGMPFVSVPGDADAPAFVRVPEPLQAAYADVVRRLLALAPAGRIAAYLEANGAVSHADLADPFAVPARLHPHVLDVGAYLDLVRQERLVEETVFLVDRSHPSS